MVACGGRITPERSHVSWFVTRTLEPGVHLIAEPFHVNSYLVEGSESRVHLDTGLGVQDIREVGDRLSARSPWVANTHYHFDHVGGNASFDEIAIHELGADLIAAGVDRGWLDEYLKWALAMYERWDTYRELDREFFTLTDDVSTLQPWPEGFDPASWSIAPSRATRVLRDHDVLDLGGRRLRVIHTPGHTADSVCFWDEEHGILFAGDAVNSGPILVDDPSADLEDFARSTRRLADDIASGIRVVYMAHGARFSAEPGYLREVADGFEAVLDGSAPLHREGGAELGSARVARFGRFAVVLPADDAG
jgi:glyoxylase-like metal-dependent hydrolase (beta-lactamase superfamily II)